MPNSGSNDLGSTFKGMQ